MRRPRIKEHFNLFVDSAPVGIWWDAAELELISNNITWHQVGSLVSRFRYDIIKKQLRNGKVIYCRVLV